MPRRTSARTVAIAPEVPPHASSPALPGPSNASLAPSVLELRRQWKWAAFSQFFFTFSSLFAMDDVSLTDIEDDLANSSNIFLPRIMQRLLFTLNGDRKISLDNWQTALRKQYNKRDPLANPMGPEPWSEATMASKTHSVVVSVEPSVEPRTQEPSVEPQNQETPASFTVDPSASTRHPTPAIQSTQENTADTPVPLDTGESSEPLPLEDPENEGEREASRDWLDLPMLTKLDSMHSLTEWQFQSPTRLRTIMKDDDEGAQWRIEPIGYDAKRNAYWLIGADRLWIQRVLPNPPKSLKRKRIDNKGKSKAAALTTIPKASNTHRQRTKRSHYQISDEETSPKATKTRRQPPTPSNGRGGRAAKTQAKAKLDAQAKELAEFQRQVRVEGGSSKRQKMEPARPLGTRVSARLRGDVEDEWQPVPKEWLADPKEDNTGPMLTNGKGGSKVMKTGLENDGESISDLTELSSERDEENETCDGAEDVTNEEMTNDEQTPDDEAHNTLVDDRGLEEPPHIPDGFIEWETICVTLYDWEHIAERFERATHYAEKGLYKVLVNEVVPIITEELKTIDRQRRIEEAIVHRKRSSRIAVKESAKEEARAAARKKAEEEEKMGRARRLQARQEKEEADRLRRETAREQRRREREENERKQAQKEDEGSEMAIDNMSETKMPTSYVNGLSSTGYIRSNGAIHTPGSGSRTPAGDDWELDCEICCRRGINQDDGSPMMCCGMCSKWQHIACHDAADRQDGRLPRNWDTEDFVCKQCRRRARGGNDHQHHSRPTHVHHDPTRFPLPAGHHRDAHAHTSHTQRDAPSIPYGGYAAARSHRPAANGAQYGQSHYSQDRGQPSPVTQSQQYPSHSAITFTHYQPQQHGFSATQTHQLNSVPQPYAPHTTYGVPSSQYQPYTVTSHAANTQPYSLQRPPQTGWNMATSSHPYNSYETVTDHSAAPAYRSEPSYRHYNGPSEPAIQQWQGPLAHPNMPEQPLNQYSGFRYHQTMGSTPNHSSP